MRPHHRPRTGRRRDGGVRRIRSDQPQAYPGVDLPPAEETVEASSADGRLLPALDTGIAVQTRLDRAQAAQARRTRVVSLSAIAALGVLLAGTIAWHYASDRMAAARPLESLLPASEPAPAAASGDASGAPSAEATLAAATPIFAHYHKVKLHLPVPMKKLTEIGFHQAAYSWALSMKTAMKNADLSLVARTRTTGRDRAEQPSGPDAIMTGKVLRMWRSSRSGRPDTAADVGALAGTTVLSPVTGTVVRVKSYKLYGRYQDFEMHIIPDDTHGIDVVLIHLTDVSVKPGDRVEGGVTPVAKVRKLSDKFHDQLADYTKSPGDHVHMQVNDSTYRGYRGLDGAVDPSEDASPTASD